MSLSQIQKRYDRNFNDFTKSRRPYWNYVLEIERGLGPLAPLVTPMVIESKCMSLSQIQKELWSF